MLPPHFVENVSSSSKKLLTDNCLTSQFISAFKLPMFSAPVPLLHLAPGVSLSWKAVT